MFTRDIKGLSQLADHLGEEKQKPHSVSYLSALVTGFSKFGDCLHVPLRSVRIAQTTIKTSIYVGLMLASSALPHEFPCIFFSF